MPNPSKQPTTNFKKMRRSKYSMKLYESLKEQHDIDAASVINRPDFDDIKRLETKLFSQKSHDEDLAMKNGKKGVPLNDRHVKKKRKRGRNRSFSAEEENLVQHDITAVSADDQSVKEKELGHKRKSSFTELDDKVILGVQKDQTLETISDLPLKKKRRRQKSSFTDLDELILGVQDPNVQSAPGQTIKEKESPKSKSSSMGLEAVLLRVWKKINVGTINDQAVNEIKHGHKSTLMELDDEITLGVQKDLNVETVNDQPVEGNKHEHKSSTMELDDEFSCANKMQRKTRSFFKLFNNDNPQKSNNNINYSNMNKHYDPPPMNLEKYNMHHAKNNKKHLKQSSSSFSSSPSDESDDSYSSASFTVPYQFVKGGKKRHTTKISSKKFDGKVLPVQHDPSQESSNGQLIVEKITFKNKSFLKKLDEGLNMQPIVQLESLSDQLYSENEIEGTNTEAKKSIGNDEIICENYIQCKTRSSFKLFNNDNPQKSNNNTNISKIKKQCDPSTIGKIATKKYSEESTSSNSTTEESDDSCSSTTFSVPYLDCSEEPVEFEVPSLHSSESLKISPEERKAFESEEVIMKMGIFSGAETALLKRNFEEFTKRFGVKAPQLLLGLGQRHKNGKVVKFLKAKHFYVRLGKDLNDRPLGSIYKRARFLFDPLRRKGRLSKKEVNSLKKCYERLGNKWQEIGNILNRSANKCSAAFQWHNKPVNVGKWRDEEICVLIKAIKTVTGITDLSKTQLEKIPWGKVAKLVPTRNFDQCRRYWLEKLSWKLKAGSSWNRKDFVKLIAILSKDCLVEESRKIDWKKVQKCFGDLAPSAELLRTKWYCLKQRLPPDNEMNYRQMLDYLLVKYNADHIE